MKHRNAEQLRIARENAKAELERRSASVVWMKDIESSRLVKVPNRPSLTAVHSYRGLKKASPCPCGPGCPKNG